VTCLLVVGIFLPLALLPFCRSRRSQDWLCVLTFIYWVALIAVAVLRTSSDPDVFPREGG
jgi:hypothetical protein